MKPKIVACGIGGLVGAPLADALAERYELVRLRRPGSPDIKGPWSRQVEWDPFSERPGAWADELEQAAALINLSGEPIAARRWTAAQKEKIRRSRIELTRTLVGAVLRARKPPAVLLNASAIGYYGAAGDRWLDEESPAGRGFLAETCARWETETEGARRAGVRVVNLRTGVVLSRRGGALAKMLPMFRLGLGGPLGSGRQVVSWIHESDEVAAVLACLENPLLEGPVNLTAPEPVTMKEFARALGRALGRPAWLPAPAPALRIFLGEMSEMLLTGQRVKPAKLSAAGHHFRYPDLPSALRALLR